MGIVWKRNGVIVEGPEAIPDRPGGGEGFAVRGNYNRPLELQSMGFVADPSDVAEHRRRFPGVELKMLDGSAVPVVRSLGQKRAYLKAANWIDSKSF